MYLTSEYYPASYFSFFYYAGASKEADPYIFRTDLIISSEIEFYFVIETQLDKKLGINIQVDETLEINSQLEITVDE
jgi:hypothetical protein